MSTSLQDNKSDFVKNSKRYILKDYDNDAPDINDNLTVNIKTFIFDRRSR